MSRRHQYSPLPPDTTLRPSPPATARCSSPRASAPASPPSASPSKPTPAGDIFGRWLMARMDLAAGNAAARRARGRCATVAVDGIVFHSPVHVGDEVTVYADLAAVGRTSMKFRVEANTLSFG